MRVRKVLAAAMAGFMVLGMAACGEQKQEGHYKVGIIQQLEHEALNAATEGFKKALTEKLGDKIQFDYQNAQGEQTNLSTIATKFVNSNVDLILANATGALQTASNATSSIPIIGVSITDFKTALPSRFDENNKPTGNVTGVSDLAPIDKQIELLHKLCPEAKNVGILYCSSEANSKYQADLAEKALDALGLSHNIYTFVDTNDISAVATKAAADCDVIYIPTDNTAADNMPLIKSVTIDSDKKVPVIAGEENMCKKGALATLSSSYTDMGYEAGLMAYDILVNGKKASDFDIKYLTDGTEKYNKEIAQTLGVAIPEGMTALD